MPDLICASPIAWQVINIWEQKNVRLWQKNNTFTGISSLQQVEFQLVGKLVCVFP